MIISADPGIDDAQAILMGLSNPKWKILAIFAHYGSSTVENTTSNAVRFLAAIHRTEVSPFSFGWVNKFYVSAENALFQEITNFFNVTAD